MHSMVIKMLSSAKNYSAFKNCNKNAIRKIAWVWDTKFEDYSFKTVSMSLDLCVKFALQEHSGQITMFFSSVLPGIFVIWAQG